MKNKRIFPILVFLILIFSTAIQLDLKAQPCNPSDITLNTQADVDNFQATYGPCTEVGGGLIIQGASITNLSGLSALTAVGGLVIQNCPSLSDLDDLNNLDAINGGNLQLVNLPNLADINGLSNLTTLNITNMELRILPLIPGISPLTSVVGASFSPNTLYVLIKDVDGVSTMDFSNFSTVILADFRVENNDALSFFSFPGFIELDGFQNNVCRIVANPNLNTLLLSGLTTVNAGFGTGLRINGNAISTLDLSALTQTNGLTIDVEPQLTNLNTLSNLHTVTSRFRLINLPALTNINGLGNLTILSDLETFILHGMPLIPDINPLTSIVGASLSPNALFRIKNVDAVTTMDFSNFSPVVLIDFRVESNDVLSFFSFPGFIELDAIPFQHNFFYVLLNPNLSTLLLPGLTTVNAGIANFETGIRINGNAISTLDLSALTQTNGLTIDVEPQLTNLNTLSNLHTVTSRFRLINLPALTDINGLGNLTTLSDLETFILYGLPLIPDINSLTSVTGASLSPNALFRIQNVDAVTTMDFSNFSPVVLIDFRVENNDVLSFFSFPGFNALDAVPFQNNFFHVRSNPNLSTFLLSGLTTVNSAFETGISIYGNAISTLDLTSLIASNGFQLDSEPQLLSLDGIPALISIDGDVFVTNNSNLCDCENFGPLLDNIDDAAPGPGPGVAGIPDINGGILIVNNKTGCNSKSEILLGAGPEIDIKGNGVSIVNGDNTPNLIDHTDFGNAIIGISTVTRTFTIQNNGINNLNLTSGTPFISINGPGASDFSISIAPVTPVSPGGASTTFDILFNPTISGLRNAELSIANDDCDENPYTFSINGKGLNCPPEFDVDVNILCPVVYYGYPPEESETLTAIASGGTPPYSYLWTPGGSGATIVVSPTITTDYTVVVTDVKNCTATHTVTVVVIDVHCGNNNNKVQICHSPPNNPNNQQDLCIGQGAVPAHLAHGDALGLCSEDPCNESEGNLTTPNNDQNPQIDNIQELSAEEIVLFPNPTNDYIYLTNLLNNEKEYSIRIYNSLGNLVFNKIELITTKNSLRLDLNGFANGVYLITYQELNGRLLTKMFVVERL